MENMGIFYFPLLFIYRFIYFYLLDKFHDIHLTVYLCWIHYAYSFFSFAFYGLLIMCIGA